LSRLNTNYVYSTHCQCILKKEIPFRQYFLINCQPIIYIWDIRTHKNELKGTVAHAYYGYLCKPIYTYIYIRTKFGPKLITLAATDRWLRKGTRILYIYIIMCVLWSSPSRGWPRRLPQLYSDDLLSPDVDTRYNIV